MSCSIQLGQRTFSSSIPDLKLSLQASASLQFSSQSPVQPSSERLKEVLCSGHIWVDQAPELKLNICVTSGSDLIPPFALFVSQLGDTICKAEMWSELRLDIIYKSCTQRPSSTIELCFGIQKRLGLPENARTPRLPKILKKLGDLHPPSDIHTAYMTSIDVVLIYNNSNHWYLRTSTDPTDDSNISLEKAHDESFDILYSMELGDGDWDELQSSSATQENRNPEFEEDKSGRWIEELDPGHGRMPESFNLQEHGKLFRAALRTLVWGDATQDDAENEHETECFQCLSGIAPSIFKPRYRDAMNQRSRLIPSIAKSLASIIELSDDQQLKDKLTTLIEKHGSDPGIVTSAATSLEDTKTILKTRLWRIAQKRLHNTPIPRQLKALPSFTNAAENESDQDGPLLESVSEQTAYFADNFEEHDASNHGPAVHIHSNDGDIELMYDFDFDLDIDGTSEQASAMIFEDNCTEKSTVMLDDKAVEPICSTQTRYSTPESNHDTVIHDFAEELHSSQISFSQRFLVNDSGIENSEGMLMCDGEDY